ncbi:MFS transporter [Streptomyces sp. NPDC048045]|uniref:MFS transporter n=1 Tax=Streptomyces sp. NPDC048045 TaxID=3154710 RepID=UPI00344692C3
MIVLAQLTVLFEATTFNLALPYVRADLHLDLGGPFSLPTVRGLAFGAVLLLGGHLADLVGRRRTLIVGLAGFAVASVLGGAAPTPTTLTMAFALQGVFAALLTPSALALVSTGFTDPKERRRALGIYVAISVGGAALTMPVAGSLMEQLDWRVCEYAAVPLAVIALAGALTLVHDRPGGSGASFDLPGVLLGCGAVAALTVGLDRARTLGWTSPLVLVLLVAGPLLLAAFWRWQTRASSPLVAPYVLKDRSRVGGHLALILSGAAVFALTTALDFYLRAIRGYAPAAAGVAFLPLGLAIVVGATQVSARLLDRTGPRALIVAGLVTAACGLALLTALTAGGGYATQVLPGMLLGGVGLGTAFMPLFALATDAVAPQHSGGASAAVTTTQQLGPVLGSALLSAVFATRLDAWPSGGAVGGSPAAFGCAAAGALLAALLAGLLITARKAATGQPARR